MTRKTLILTRSMTKRSLRSRHSPSYKIEKKTKLGKLVAFKSRSGTLKVTPVKLARKPPTPRSNHRSHESTEVNSEMSDY